VQWAGAERSVGYMAAFAKGEEDMPTRLIKQGSVITTLAFLVWFGFAVIFPDDRLDLKETIFVWVAIALALVACQAALRSLTRHRRTRTDAVDGRLASDDG
jgi:hypothetical protein